METKPPPSTPDAPTEPAPLDLVAIRSKLQALFGDELTDWTDEMVGAAAVTLARVETEHALAAAEKPTNVIAALAAVMREIPGIGKTEDSTQGYRYRGIESITAHAQQLLGKYGVVFVPRVEKRTVKEFPINSKPWTEDCAEVVYTVYGPGGLEDHIEVGPLIGLGRDNSDKGMNKCMTQVFKYALIQTLCIGDGKDDADKDAAATPDAPTETMPPEQKVRSDLRARISALSSEGRAKVRVFCDDGEIPRVTARMDDDQIEKVTEFIDGLETAAAQDAAAETPQDVTTPAEAPQERSEPENAVSGADETPRAAETQAAPTDDDLNALGRDHPDQLEAAIAEVTALDARGVDKALTKPFRLPSDGHIDVRRRRLTVALLRRKVDAVEANEDPFVLVVPGHTKGDDEGVEQTDADQRDTSS